MVLWLMATLFADLPLRADWKKLQSEHFEIYTRESGGSARQVLQHLEQVRSAYQVLTNSKIERASRGRVVLLKNKSEYQRYAPSMSDAYYVRAGTRDYIVLYLSDSPTGRVLNHEYFHLFSRHAKFQFPPWLEEGMADFFSTLKITNKEIHMGLPVEPHLQYLNYVGGKATPLQRIFNLRPTDRHQTEREVVLQLYAQGWALTHMTFLGGNMRSRSGEFLAATSKGEDPTEVYQKVYGASVKDLDELLGKYIQQSSYLYVKVPAAGLDQRATVQETSMESWEAPLLLGHLQQYVGRVDEASAMFEDLARQYPQVPDIAEAQGYLAMMSMERETAVGHFRRAAETGSTNPNLYYDLTSTSCKYTEFDPQCQRWINEALRLNPDSVDARRWAVGYVLNARKFDQAIVYLARWNGVKAAEAPDYFYQYAYALANLDRMDEARKAIQRGLEFATTDAQRSRLSKLQELTERSAEYRKQVQALTEVVETARPDGSGRGLRGDGEEEDLPEFGGGSGPTPATRPRIRRGVPQEVVREVDALTRELEGFLQDDDAVLVAAVAKRLVCGKTTVLEVSVRAQTLRLVIDDPQSARIFVDGEAQVDHEFTCGTQQPKTVMVGYVARQAPDGTDGLLRILSFQ
jgi:tetratricopeptide (TPR) repeat protein